MLQFNSLKKTRAPWRGLRSVLPQIGALGIAIGVVVWFVSATIKQPYRELTKFSFPEKAHWIKPQGDAMAWGVFRLDFVSSR